MLKAIKTAVIGGSGYTGLELVKLLIKHKYANLSLLTSNTYSGMALQDAFAYFKNLNCAGIAFKATDSITYNDFAATDLVFLCLPPHQSMEFASNYLKDYRGKIIDIGSDFRIKDPESYREWYGKDHIATGMLKDFIYGLPEINWEQIKQARYIANPGCYPTSVLLCLAPLAGLLSKNEPVGKEPFSDKILPCCGGPDIKGQLQIADINIDSKSGVSGAGRKLKDEYLFCSANENFYAYGPLLHRHIGEMEQEIEELCGSKFAISFTPHLLPVERGIFTSVYCKLRFGASYNEKSCCCDSNSKTGSKDAAVKEIVESLFSWYYKNCLFVKFIGQKIPQIKDVLNTNFCHIGYAYDNRTDTLKLFSAIDNLLKGAAGQAIQNMNIMFGFKQEEGLNE